MARTLWTRVECQCGACAAIPEAGFYPLCARCGLRMVAASPRVCYVSEPMSNEQAVLVSEHEPSGAIPGHRPMYLRESLRAELKGLGFPVDPQPWPERPSPDGHSYTAPPWEVP